MKTIAILYNEFLGILSKFRRLEWFSNEQHYKKTCLQVFHMRLFKYYILQQEKLYVQAFILFLIWLQIKC